MDGTGEEIRMEDILGKGTRKRPYQLREDVDELQVWKRGGFEAGCWL